MSIVLCLVNAVIDLDPRDSGGGIGGLTFAIALSKTAPHIEVDLYESASAFGMVGAGIGMWPRVWDALKAIGLKDELDKYSASSATGGTLISNV